MDANFSSCFTGISQTIFISLATLKYTQSGHQSDAGTLPVEGKMWAGGKTVRLAGAFALSCSALCHTPFIRTSTLEPQSQE